MSSAKSQNALEVQEQLARLGWREDDLRARRKGEVRKVMLARRLRRETPMSLKWIAKRLHMGRWTYVSNLLNAKPGPPECQRALDLFQ